MYTSAENATQRTGPTILTKQVAENADTVT